MTIVFWDGKELIADRMASEPDSFFATTKIGKLKDGSLYGVAGNAHSGYILHWLNGERDPANYPSGTNAEGEVMVITKKNQIFIYNEHPFPDQVEMPHWAIGCGSVIALATYKLVRDGVASVLAVCELSPACGVGVDAISFKDKAPRRLFDITTRTIDLTTFT